MRRTWTIIGVGDVARSLAWYQTLLGLPKSAPAHDYFGQILDADGTVLLCLHQWGTHGHPPLTRPDPPPGNGLLLFFRVDDFDEALSRARWYPGSRRSRTGTQTRQRWSSAFGIRMATT
jgi:catechol 2,3-dioxygenase-like lactoylglutathione lyase family enzyme